MPEENGGDSPSRNPEGETLGQNPRPSLPEQRIVGQKAADDPDREEHDSEKPTGRVHWINHATFYLSVILVVLTAGTIRVYYLQLQQMIKVTRATQDSAYDACMSAKIARQTLLEVQSGEQDAHNSASGSLLQASAAARAQAGLLTLSMGQLIYSNSPTAATDSDPKKWEHFNLAFTFSNIGRSSIRNLHIDFAVQLLPQGTEPNFSGRQYYPNKSRSGIVQPGDAVSSTTIMTDANGKVLKQENIPMEDFRSGKLWVVDFGRAEYQDIFGISHWQTFCGITDNLPMDPENPKMRHLPCGAYNRQDSNLLFTVAPSNPVNAGASIEPISCPVPKH